MVKMSENRNKVSVNIIGELLFKISEKIKRAIHELRFQGTAN
jgi:hypothetical protein